MSQSPRNQAAWLVAKAAPLQVKDAPYVEPGPGEVLVRNRAIAVNPVDWMLQVASGLLFGWIKPPFVLGSDIAGEVAAVGPGVTEVKAGDRVLAMAAGMCKVRNRSSEGAFQAYSIVLPHLTTAIPDAVSYEEAAVVPLGVVTAACGLFQSGLLALQPPTANPPARGEWVLVWGGATSVGCNAIQLAVSAGYSVITTCSPKNFDYVKSLGATLAFDYNDRDVTASMIAALKGKRVAGALSIGAGSTDACIDILAECQGRKFIAACSAPIPLSAFAKAKRVTLPLMLTLLPNVLGTVMRTRGKARRTGVTEKFFDASIMVDDPITPAIFHDYLGPALADGRFRPAPPPRVVGRGLAHIQTALDTQKNGVSAAKIVVTLD